MRKGFILPIILTVAILVAVVFGTIAYFKLRTNPTTESQSNQISPKEIIKDIISNQDDIAIIRNGDVLLMDQRGTVLKNLSDKRNDAWEAKKAYISPNRSVIAYLLYEKAIDTTHQGRMKLLTVDKSSPPKDLITFEVSTEKNMESDLIWCTDNKNIIFKEIYSESPFSFNKDPKNLKFSESTKMINSDTNEVKVIHEISWSMELTGSTPEDFKSSTEITKRIDVFGCNSEEGKIYAFSDGEKRKWRQLNAFDLKGKLLHSFNVDWNTPYHYKFFPQEAKIIINDCCSPRIMEYKIGEKLEKGFLATFDKSQTAGNVLWAQDGNTIFYFMGNLTQATFQTVFSSEFRKVKLSDNSTTILHKSNKEVFKYIDVNRNDKKVLVESGSGTGTFKLGILDTESGTIQDIPGLEGKANEYSGLISWM